MRMWVFVTNITDEFILGLNILRAYYASLEAASGRGRGIVMEPGSGNPSFQARSGQGTRDTRTMRRDIDGCNGEPPWSRKWSGRTKPASHPPEMIYKAEP
jgi:hypothetical protein